MMQSSRKIVPLQEIEREITVVNSKFIASLSPASGVDEARQYIRLIKERYPTANHHVPAFLIGHGQSVIAHCNDDGEPSGTAGRPVLAVLQGSGIRDVVVVVTRYFGGTKLGTGGLVRAYGDAVREALRFVKLAELVSTSMLHVLLDYPYYEPVRRLLERRHALLENEQFSEKVELTFRILTSFEQQIEKEINELSSGRSSISILQTGQLFRIPLDKATGC